MSDDLLQIPLTDKPLIVRLNGRFGDSPNEVRAEIYLMKWSNPGSWGGYLVREQVTFEGEQSNGSEIIGSGQLQIDPKKYNFEAGKYEVVSAYVSAMNGKQPLNLVADAASGPLLEFLLGDDFIAGGYSFNNQPFTMTFVR